MGFIRILTENVATKIAAGEVIERPASVVRELMDNSIDAGSDRIFVKVERGGRELIRISDNGVGMDKDDLLLCVERHATSKIKEASDLMSIETLGFRGEAIPSIASVSRMKITSRPAEEVVGYSVTMAGGRMRSIDETGCPAGTAIEVRNLFYNMPARKKFLRAVRTEFELISEIFSRIALPFVGIHFRLEDGDKTACNLPASGDHLNRLSILLGRQVASSMEEYAVERDTIRIRAYLAPPEMSRSRGDRILTYVNNRNVRDRLMTRAVMEGYGQRLMKGRYPQVVVFMAIDPSIVDVNVHPTKQEIRFHNVSSVYQGLMSVIEKSFKKSYPSAGHSGSTPVKQDLHGSSGDSPVAEAPASYDVMERGRPPGKTSPLLFRGKMREEDREVIGQLKDTYILCATRNGLLIVDQHAAHERIVYEDLLKAYRGSKIQSQSFLIPHQLELSRKDAAILLKKIEPLRELGFELEHFGGNTFLVRAVPSLLTDLRWEAFLEELAPVLEEERDPSRSGAQERMFIVMACHGAIRAGKRLSRQEMESLLTQLEQTDVPTHCPHGRPISQSFTYLEIEKMFKRVL